MEKEEVNKLIEHHYQKINAEFITVGGVDQFAYKLGFVDGYLIRLKQDNAQQEIKDIDKPTYIMNSYDLKYFKKCSIK